MTQDPTLPSAGHLARLGFAEPAAARESLAGFRVQPDALMQAAARSADPDQAFDFLVAVADVATDRPALEAALDTDSAFRERLLRVLGASAGLGEHLLRHPEHWHELADPDLGRVRPTARALRAALLEAVGADPLRAGARRRGRLGRSGRAAGGVPAAAPPACRPRPRRRRGGRRRGCRAGRPRGRGARGGACDRPRATPGRIGGLPPGRHRPRQVRRPRAQLCERRGRPVRRRARGRSGGGQGAADGDPARVPGHPDLLRPHRRGHAVASRRRPASGGQAGAARPYGREPSRVRRAVGQDVGVPGAAEGADGRRRRRAGPGVPRRGRAARLAGGRPRPGFVDDVAGHAPAGRRPHPGRRGRPAAEARPRRAAGRRVRGPTAAARPRPVRPDAAQPVDRWAPSTR